MAEELRAFMGMTAFEELCRQWTIAQGQAGRLPCGKYPIEVQEVGGHWSRGVQVDVVAINWAERTILLGECKWGTGAVDRSTMGEMIETRAPRVLKILPDEGAGWKAHYAFFARAGFTTAARQEAADHHALLIDLETLNRDLCQEGGIP